MTPRSPPDREASRGDAASVPAVPAWVFAWIAVIAIVLITNPVLSDFRIIYDSAVALSDGRDPYVLAQVSDLRVANLNLPHVTGWLVAPLTIVSTPLAGVLWTLGQAAIWFAVLLHLRKHVKLGDGPLIFAAVVPATLLQLVLGQLGWLLAGIVYAGWWADRTERPRRAGVLLGLAIAIKPFLLPLVPWWLVVGRVRSAAVALAVTIAVFALGLISFGPPLYASWLAVTQHIDWVGIDANASIWGAVVRYHLPTEIAIAVSFCVGAGAALIGWREGSTDRTWTAALLAILIACPLGWLYYLPLLAGPGLSSWQLVPRRVRYVILGCICCPPGLLPLGVVGLGLWFASICWAPLQISSELTPATTR